MLEHLPSKHEVELMAKKIKKIFFQHQKKKKKKRNFLPLR
jgi:hypothetical protein